MFLDSAAIKKNIFLGGSSMILRSEFCASVRKFLAAITRSFSLFSAI